MKEPWLSMTRGSACDVKAKTCKDLAVWVSRRLGFFRIFPLSVMARRVAVNEVERGTAAERRARIAVWSNAGKIGRVCRKEMLDHKIAGHAG